MEAVETSCKTEEKAKRFFTRAFAYCSTYFLFYA
jgi:hypothetical protein